MVSKEMEVEGEASVVEDVAIVDHEEVEVEVEAVVDGVDGVDETEAEAEAETTRRRTTIRKG